VALDRVLYRDTYDYSDPTRMGRKVRVPRAQDFTGTALEPMFAELQRNAGAMLRPRATLYWRFLTDTSIDSHFFGGIWPEVLGTLYLTLGAMLFALPMGVVSAIYLVEYAGESRSISLLRTFVSTLAGVPSIVFGLFGLAFFINGLHVTHGKSLIAGSLTLALLVLPTVIRASEEAIRAVPQTYKEAALSVGASKWRAIVSIVLPASLPGILTGVVISMGRAAGETAPIIFTAAVSVGKALDFAKLKFWNTLAEPTPALPWNIYNLATEHEAVDEIRHVQFGMVFTLVGLVLLLNAAAIVLRARIARKLKG
jgi:phosphate transport system permease protein